MSSDAVRQFEIQLEVHKRFLREKSERINELEARSIDLEVQAKHLKEVIDTQRAHSKQPSPAVDSRKAVDREARSVGEGERENVHSGSDDLEPTRRKRNERNYVPDSLSFEPEHKRRRPSPEEVVQPRFSNASHHVNKDRGYNVTASTVPTMTLPNPPVGPGYQASNASRPEPNPTPVTSSVPNSSLSGVRGPTSRTHDLPRRYLRSRLIVTSEPEWESNDDLGLVDNNVVPKETSQNASPRSAVDRRLANVDSFDPGIASEEYLDVTSDRLALSKRLDCKGNGTVVRSRDGKDYLFPSRKQHPYALSGQGKPDSCRRAPGKYKYMGEYTLEPMDALEPEEFKALPRGTKTLWGSNILKQKTYGPIRRQILNRQPHSKTLDADDIIRAYENREEKLYVWKMRCIKFDEKLLEKSIGDWSPAAPRDLVSG